jgi:hypothetical protein
VGGGMTSSVSGMWSLSLARRRLKLFDIFSVLFRTCPS